MSGSLALLVALGTLGALVLAGGWPDRVVGGATGLDGLPLAFATGALVLHLALAAATLAGRGWSLALAATALAAAAIATRVRGPHRWPRLERPGIGLLVAGAVALLVVRLGVVGDLTQPDFYYHWALKARRFLEIGGADYLFLSGPSAWRLHPDYPLLVPELWLLPSLAAGAWSERSALALAALVVALTLVAYRRALAGVGLGGTRLELATAVGAAILGSFVVGYGLVGAADPMIALALLVALPALVDERAPSAGRGWELGLAAALAAASKIEGVPLALLLIGIDALARTLRRRRPPPLAHLVRSAAPTLVVVLPWYGLARAYDLFLATNGGAWRWQRAAEIFPAAAESALHSEWAFAPLLLLALPLALARRRLVAATAVVALQLAIYFAVYFTGPVDTRLYVLSTLPRLLFHLLPATFVLLSGRFLAPAECAFNETALPPESSR